MTNIRKMTTITRNITNSPFTKVRNRRLSGEDLNLLTGLQIKIKLKLFKTLANLKDKGR